MLGLNNPMKMIYVLISMALLSSCCRSSLTVQTDYLTHRNLASYYVGTPDPRQNVPAVGQRLIISWMVPKSYFGYENLHLEIAIRFRNREEVTEIFHILKTRGTYVFILLNEDYFTKKGILTYKVNLIGGNQILETWQHSMWVELITVDHENDAAEKQSVNENNTEACDADKDEEYPINWDEEPL
jgi:hypothetical protein